MKLNELINAKKKEKERKEKLKIAKAAATTAAVGTVLGALGGLLFAPKSGKKTREEIADASKKFNEEIKVKAVKTKEVLTEKTKNSKDNINEARDKIASYLAAKREKDIETIEMNEEAEKAIDETEV